MDAQTTRRFMRRVPTSTLQGNAWQQITPSGTPPTARRLHVAAWSDTVDGLYIFGGADDSGGSWLWMK